jgi:hypothetical protein
MQRGGASKAARFYHDGLGVELLRVDPARISGLA